LTVELLKVFACLQMMMIMARAIKAMIMMMIMMIIVCHRLGLDLGHLLQSQATLVPVELVYLQKLLSTVVLEYFGFLKRYEFALAKYE